MLLDDGIPVALVHLLVFWYSKQEIKNVCQMEQCIVWLFHYWK